MWVSLPLLPAGRDLSTPAVQLLVRGGTHPQDSCTGIQPTTCGLAIYLYLPTYLQPSYLHTYLPYLPTYLPTYLRSGYLPVPIYLPTVPTSNLPAFIPTYPANLNTYLGTYLPVPRFPGGTNLPSYRACLARLHPPTHTAFLPDFLLLLFLRYLANRILQKCRNKPYVLVSKQFLI